MTAAALCFSQRVLDGILQSAEVFLEENRCPAESAALDGPYFAVFRDANQMADELCSPARLLFALGLDEREDSS